MKLREKTPPAAEPVFLTDAKAHMRVDIDDDDKLIAAMISAARERAEDFCQRSFVTQSLYLYLDAKRAIPYRDKVGLPMGPIQSVDAFEYQSAPGTWTAVDTSLYYVDLPGEQIVLTPYEGTVSYPEPAQHESGFRVTYTAGYGTMPAEAASNQGTGTGTLANPVPNQIQLAIKTFVLHFYENREAYADGDFKNVPAAGESLLMPFRKMDF